MKRSVATVLILVSILFSLTAYGAEQIKGLGPILSLLLLDSSYEPTITLPKTGQTTCYDELGNIINCLGTGQDGEIQAGVPWPNPRYVDNGDGTLTDKLTGLMWLQDANCIGTNYPEFDLWDWYPTQIAEGQIPWKEAFRFVSEMNVGSYPACAKGYNDWMVPNVYEISSILDELYPVSLHGSLWTSNTMSHIPNYAYSIYMGSIAFWNRSKTEPVDYLYPVRHTNVTSTISLPKTGQTTCYDELGNIINCLGTGQDGEIQAGVPWPNPRYVDNGDGTLTDKLTGLMWLQDMNCIGTNYPEFDLDDISGDGGVNWQHALDFINGINNDTYSKCGANHNDWRLPNLREIESLPYLKQPYSDYGFINGSGSFWSSTTNTLTGNNDEAFALLATRITSPQKYDYIMSQVLPVRNGNL